MSEADVITTVAVCVGIIQMVAFLAAMFCSYKKDFQQASMWALIAIYMQLQLAGLKP